MSAFSFSRIRCVGDDAAFAAVVTAAARLAFPGAQVAWLSRFEDAPAPDSADGGELLALCDPAAATLTAARAVLDDVRLPRWAVVVFGAPPDAAAGDVPEAIARSEWNAPLVARAFRSAAALHQLGRENARLRGDLATFGFRIAHDLRTPIGGVLTTTEMLKEVLVTDAPDAVPLTQPILDSVDGLVKLIDRMSLFAKASASRGPAQRLDMGGPFWDAFQKLERQIGEIGASLTHPKTWPAVEGRANWLEAVWRILIENALQHGGAGVRVTAGWSRVEGGHRFWLRDSGSVSPKMRDTLFFPFHRLHDMDAPRGLGLPLVQRLVELQGGRCGFEAPAEGGSCFYFVLPAIDDAYFREANG